MRTSLWNQNILIPYSGNQIIGEAGQYSKEKKQKKQEWSNTILQQDLKTYKNKNTQIARGITSKVSSIVYLFGYVAEAYFKSTNNQSKNMLAS